MSEEPGGFPALLSTRQRIAIWVPLVDDSWLRFSTRSALPSMGWVVHMSAQLMLLCLVLILFALVAARQITRPIRTFVAATERLGTDVNAPPIPERGSRELRRVTRVFNTMQDRLQRYVDDRTRMLAAISHDLRTPLTRLKLQLAMLGDSKDVQALEADIDEMQQMVEEYLSFARGEGLEQAVESDLPALLADIVETAQRNGTCGCRI